MITNVFDEYNAKYRFLLERAEAELKAAKQEREQLPWIPVDT